MCQWSLPRSISSIGEDGNVLSFDGEFLTLFATFVAFRICCCCCSMRDWTLLLPSALGVKGKDFKLLEGKRQGKRQEQRI